MAARGFFSSSLRPAAWFSESLFAKGWFAPELIPDAASSATTLASDNFNRADGGLGANWGSVASLVDALISSNTARASDGAGANRYVGSISGGTWPNDQYAECTITVLDAATDAGCGPACRMEATGASNQSYFAQCSAVETNLYKVTSGGGYALLATGAAVTAGDVLRLECSGSSITLKKNGATFLGPVTDTDITSGQAGFWATGSATGNGSIDNWSGGSLGAGGGSSYSLTITAGSYALTGQTAGLRAARRMAAAQGSYALTGNATGTTAARRLAAAQGSYALTGQATGLRKGQVMPAAAGTYALTGQSAGLIAARRLAAAQGSYGLAGQATGLRKGQVMLAAQGSYGLTGQPAGLLAVRRLAAAQGSYALTGQTVTLTYVPAPALAEAGFYVVTGFDVTFTTTASGGAGSPAPIARVPIRYAARTDRLKQLDYPTLVADATVEADTNAGWAKRNWARILRLRIRKVPVP